MGYTTKHGTWDLHVKALRLLGRTIPELRVAELGSQEIKKDVFGRVFPARDYWELHGARVASFDRNGKFGANPLNLGLPLPKSLWGKFDLVTNYGCSEHVETSQYWCWRNTHELAADGTGLIVHAVPMVGSWQNHCNIWYTEKWLLRLSDACCYYAAHIDQWGKPPWMLLRGIFSKVPTDASFPLPGEFKELFDGSGCIDRT
jgi:hypothetical protein